MKKAIITLCLLVSATFAFSSEGDAFCLVLPGGPVGSESPNKGYCVEGLDGKGKCVKISLPNTSRCYADQPTIN